MRSKRSAAVLCLLAFSASAASATPLSYSETVSGDLNGAPTLALDSGLNTISGNFAIGAPQVPELPDDLGDEFTFAIPVGRTLTDVTFEFQVSSDLVTEWLDTVAIAEVPGIPPFLYTGQIDLTGPSPVSPFGTVNVVSGAYAMLFPHISYAGPIGTTATYRWSLVVDGPGSTVPEPASLSLLALGLVGLGARRWWQRKA